MLQRYKYRKLNLNKGTQNLNFVGRLYVQKMCQTLRTSSKYLDNIRFVSNLSIYNLMTLNEAHLRSEVSEISVTKAKKKKKNK